MCSLLYPDETEFRNFIVWLEDQKVRHYKIEDRGNLRNIPSPDWPKHFEKVRQIYLHMYMTICIPKEINTLKFIMSFVVIYKYICLQYLQDVNCPFSAQERQETVDWLLGLAVRFEYGDNGMMIIIIIIINQWLYSTVVILIADTTFRE